MLNTSAAVVPESLGASALTDLDERLHGPEGAVVAKVIEAKLGSLKHRLDAALADGMAPQDFAKTQIIATAIESARRVLASVRRASNKQGE